MRFIKINTLTVILLLSLIEIFSVLFLIYDFFYDSNHCIEFLLVLLNTMVLCYYLYNHKSKIRFCYQKLSKYVGKYK